MIRPLTITSSMTWPAAVVVRLPLTTWDGSTLAPVVAGEGYPARSTGKSGGDVVVVVAADDVGGEVADELGPEVFREGLVGGSEVGRVGILEEGGQEVPVAAGDGFAEAAGGLAFSGLLVIHGAG